MVDLSLVLDVSSSIGWRWRRGSRRVAARSWTPSTRRRTASSLIFFCNGARVVDAMPAGRGFDKRGDGRHPQHPARRQHGHGGGHLSRWDELRSVPNGQQSGLRVIVLFTDGASNGVPGIYTGSATSRRLRTYDFPEEPAGSRQPDHDSPTISGLYDSETGASVPDHRNVAYRGTARHHSAACRSCR